MKSKLVIKTQGEDIIKDLSDEEYKKILLNAIKLVDFDYINFLSTNYLKAKTDFEQYNFSKSGIQEVEAFNIIFNALNSIVTNIYVGSIS